MTAVERPSWTVAERAALDELLEAGGGPRSLLVVHEHPPRFDASGSDLRLLQLVEAFAGAGHRVTLLGRNDLGVARYRETLEALGVEVLAPDPERLFWERSSAPRIDLAALCAERRFDVAVLFHWYWSGVSVTESYLPELRRSAPATRICVLTDDVHWLREERRAERAGGRGALERSRALRHKEQAAYARADLLLTITDDDAARIAADHPGLPMANLGFCHEAIAEPAPGSVPGFDARRDLLFLGSGVNDANARAVEWFVERCLPRIRERLPDVRLRIVGEEPPGTGWAGAETAAVVPLGRVDELEPHLAAARVFVSPVTYGTGLKTKNIQALGSGLPQVLTSISAEGMRLTGDEAAFVRDDPDAFAAAVCALYADRGLWERTSLASLRHARAHFSRERVVRDCAVALRRTLALEPRAHDPERDALGLPEEILGSPHPQPMAKVYDGYVRRSNAHKAAGRLEAARHELRLALCAFCCWPPDTPVLGELHTLLASLYLADGEHAEAAEAAAEALSHPRVQGRTRAVLEGIRSLCTVALSA